MTKIILAADPFGEELKTAVQNHLQSKGILIEDLGTNGKYYEAAATVGRRISQAKSPDLRGVLFCGTGMGMSILSNKFPGVYAAVVENEAAARNAKAINNANVLSLGGLVTTSDEAIKIVDAWLEQEFTGPAPASKSEPWKEDIVSFLKESQNEIPVIEGSTTLPTCPCCILNPKWEPVPGVKGAEWQKFRDDRTTALVKFPKGAIEPPHHHTTGHVVYVTKGSKRVENLTTGETAELKQGDYLYTPALHSHKVVYHEDVEFFFVCDSQFDVFWDTDEKEVYIPPKEST